MFVLYVVALLVFMLIGNADAVVSTSVAYQPQLSGFRVRASLETQATPFAKASDVDA